MTLINQTYDIAAFGEFLMDMTPIQTPLGKGFIANPGGAPCNFLAMASRMGSSTMFFGKVGNDDFGRGLLKAATEAGIGTLGLVRDEKVPTTLAFVHLDDEGDRSFSFYRKGCADVSLELKEVDLSNFDRAKALYFGSLAMTDEPLKSTATVLVQRAKASGKLLLCDPNYRPALWTSSEAAVEAMMTCVNQAHIVKVSDEEIRLLTGKEDLWAAGEVLLAAGTELVFITKGPLGSIAMTPKERVEEPALQVHCVDTTGAGDAFFGTVASAMLSEGIDQPQALKELSSGQLRDFLRLGNIAAGLCVTKHGAIPALPSRDEVLSQL